MLIDVDCPCQANLDVAYIEKRYGRGKAKAEEWMNAEHMYHLNPKSLKELQAEMIHHRRRYGPEDSLLAIMYELSQVCCLLVVTVSCFVIIGIFAGAPQSSSSSMPRFGQVDVAALYHTAT